MDAVQAATSSGEETFRLALERLETALMTPIVSGELQSWTSEVQQAAEAAACVINERIKVDHPELFRAIRREDPELNSRVDQLQKTDDANLEAVAAWMARLSSIDQKAEQVEPDEGRVSGHLAGLVDQVLGSIMNLRKQETAIRTWFAEAFQRDRGTID